MAPEVRRRVTLASSLALLWTVFTLVAQFSGAMETFEQPIVDWMQSQTAYPAPPSDQLALVEIDNIPDDRPWPWPRLDYSLMLRGLVDYVPDSVVFEMNLYDSDPQYDSFDSTFAEVVGRANTVIFSATATMLDGSNAAPGPLPSNVPTIPFEGDARFVPRFPSAIWPLATFASKSPTGIGNIEASAGLHCHNLPMVFIVHQTLVPSLCLLAAAQILGADLNASEVQLGHAIYLRSSNGTLLRTIPIDSTGRMQIRFHSTPAASWVAPFDNILVDADDMKRGVPSDQDLHQLGRRQVWVGRTDSTSPTRYQTPVGTLTSLQVQMQAERDILAEDYIRPLPPVIIAMIYFSIAIGGAVLSIRLGPIHAAALVIVTLSFWLETALIVFRACNILLPFYSFGALLFGCYAVGFLALSWELEPLARNYQRSR
jgi:adenylate cyclase